jgi:hypothetical protein
MADLITRILLNSEQFDNNIKKSAQQITNFQKNAKVASDGFKTAMGFAAKAVGGVGLALSAKEAFDKFVSSSQSTSDAFNKEVSV